MSRSSHSIEKNASAKNADAAEREWKRFFGTIFTPECKHLKK